MVHVKICGITNSKDAVAAADLGAAAIGFIFYKKSPRFISPVQAKKIINLLPSFITPVGVFVNEKEGPIKRIAEASGLRVLQFHGDESPAFCRRFRSFKVIKAFRVKSSFSIHTIKNYSVSALLFDTYQQEAYGGTGQAFDWSLLKGIRKMERPIILSGGLNANNVAQAIAEIQPYAVDVSSGVEERPGKKSLSALRTFFRSISLASVKL